MPQPTDLTIILAAGKSTRIAELSFDRPKTLLSVSGQTLLARLCMQFAGVTRRFVIVAGKNHAALAAHLADMELAFDIIDDESLTEHGNADSLRAGLARFDDSYAACHIIESDVVLTQEAVDVYLGSSDPACGLVIPVNHPSDDKFFHPGGTDQLAISKEPPADARILGKFLGVTRLPAVMAQRLALSIPERAVTPYIKYLTALMAEYWPITPLSVSSDHAMEIDTSVDYRAVLMNRHLARPIRCEVIRFRPRTALVLDGALKRLIGVHDSVGARLAQRNGFDGLWLGSFQIALASGGRDDASYDASTALELAERLRNSGIDLPLVVDIGNGFSNSETAQAFVERAVAAKVAAICVEDNNEDRLCSLYGSAGRALVSPEAFACRVRELVEIVAGRLWVIARTEALTIGLSPDQAAERLHHATNAGADALLPHYVGSNFNVIRAFMTEYPLLRPVLLVPTGLMQHSVDEFKDIGCAGVVYANIDLRLRFNLLQDAYARLSSEGVVAKDVHSALADPLHMKEILGN